MTQATRVQTDSAETTKKRAPVHEEVDRPELGAVLEFMRLIWALDHGLQRTSKRMKVRLGVTGPQRLVIRVVARYPDISAGELATLLHVHASTLTGILKRLELDGVLLRRVDEQDRRRIRLSLSTKGQRLDRDSEGTVEAAVRSVLRTQPKSRIRAAEIVLALLGTSLNETAGPVSRAGQAHAARRGR